MDGSRAKVAPASRPLLVMLTGKLPVRLSGNQRFQRLSEGASGSPTVSHDRSKFSRAYGAAAQIQRWPALELRRNHSVKFQNSAREKCQGIILQRATSF